MDTEKRIREIEKHMAHPSFWEDKETAKEVVKEYNELKTATDSTYDTYPAVIHIIAGTGGDDAEDFARMLAEMYTKYATRKKFTILECDSNRTTQGGYKNITMLIDNPTAYDLLKNETGVHRLVRISPFNAKKQRHTSFALVDVTPKIPPIKEVAIPEDDIEVSFSNAGGPGGQNVNKRETAVRVTHIPTTVSVRVKSERSQGQNRERAMEILRGKLFSLMQRKRTEEIRDLSSEKGKSIEWGNQIRSYVLHPYKLVKDMRVNYEERDPEKVFDGDIDGFLQALRGYSE